MRIVVDLTHREAEQLARAEIKAPVRMASDSWSSIAYELENAQIKLRAAIDYATLAHDPTY
jgi:hypothetical protein